MGAHTHIRWNSRHQPVYLYIQYSAHVSARLSPCRNFLSAVCVSRSDADGGSAFHSAMDLYRNARLVDSSLQRGICRWRSDALVALAETWFLGVKRARRAAGARGSRMTARTFRQSRSETISRNVGHPRAWRAGVIWSLLCLPEATRTAKFKALWTRACYVSDAPPQTGKQ